MRSDNFRMRDKRKGDKQNTFYWHFMIKVRIISEKCMLFLKMQLVEVGGNFLNSVAEGSFCCFIQTGRKES